jgi:hypothetical protein
MPVVASAIDDSTERIIRYLSETYGVDINAARFHFFKAADGRQLLVRTFTVALEQAETTIEVGVQDSNMPITPNIPDKFQIRLTSSAESILASLEPYSRWIEQTLDAPLSETLTLEVDCNPADAVAEELLHELPVVSATKARNSNWRTFIEGWPLAADVSPRIAVQLVRSSFCVLLSSYPQNLRDGEDAARFPSNLAPIYFLHRQSRPQCIGQKFGQFVIGHQYRYYGFSVWIIGKGS